MNNDFGKFQIPFTFGIEARVILGGIISGACRSIIECPLDYTKVNIYDN